eukprot:12586340-Ditylum_brightwellii.AAC.1
MAKLLYVVKHNIMLALKSGVRIELGRFVHESSICIELGGFVRENGICVGVTIGQGMYLSIMPRLAQQGMNDAD